MARRKYPEEFVSKIISEYNNGKSVVELSCKYNIWETTIHNWLRKRNVPTNGTDRLRQKYTINNDHAEIYIKSKGSFVKALIDIEDIERCKSLGIWSLVNDEYVFNCKNNIYLHRFIMNCPDDMEVDHIHHNPLDNRKSQLRIATSSQQKMNTHIRKDNKSGHRGVYYDKARDTWNVHLKNGNDRITKRFKNIDDAVEFCKKKMSELHGNFQYKKGESCD